MKFEKFVLVALLIITPIAAFAETSGQPSVRGQVAVLHTPSASSSPTATPTATPSATPTPTHAPTPTPTPSPTPTPTPVATPTPTSAPTSTPSSTPTVAPATPFVIPTGPATASPAPTPPAPFVPLVIPGPTPTPPATLPPPRGAQRYVFKPPSNSTTKAYVNPECGSSTPRALSPQLASGEVLVGWNFAGGTHCGVVYRSGAWFGDFAKGMNVLNATLTFYVSRSTSNAQGNPLTGNVSCAGQVQMAVSSWMNNSDSAMALLGTPFLTIPANQPGDTESLGQFAISSGMFVSVDVTQAVQQWAAGSKRNYGFVLAPARTEFNGPSDRCFSVYNGFALTVDTKK